MRKLLYSLMVFLAMSMFGITAAFALPGYGFRQILTIDNTGGPALTDYQVLFVVNTQALVAANKMQPDGDDIRFTADPSCNTIYCYSIEKPTMNTANTNLWIKIPAIPANGRITIQFWYGNPAATRGEDGVCTFDLFDDFDGNQLDAAKWRRSFSTGTMTFNNSQIQFNNANFGENQIISIPAMPNPSISEIYVNAFAGNWPDLAQIRGGGINNSNGFTMFHSGGTMWMGTSDWNGGCSADPQRYQAFLQQGQAIGGGIGVWGMFWTALNTQRFYWPGNTVNANINPINFGTYPATINQGFGMICGGAGSMSVDWARTRKYTPVPPRVTAGQEQLNTVTVTPLNPQRCAQDPPTQLTANYTLIAGAVYTWNPGNIQGAIANVSPNVTTTYTVTALTPSGCGGQATVTVTVLPAPILTPTQNPPGQICPGQAVQLDAGGNANNFTWTPAPCTPNCNQRVVTVNPTVTTIYTVSGPGANGCIGTGTIQVTVFNNAPNLSVTPASPTRCASDPPTQLTASGAQTFTWMPGNLSGATVNVSPLVTTTYTLTGTSANGCTGTLAVLVTVLPSPNQPPPINGTVIPCTGTTRYRYSITPTVGETYIWAVNPPGATITGANPPINSQVDVTFNVPVGAYTLSVTPRSAQGCLGTPRDLPLNVIDRPSQPGAITGASPLCPGGRGDYTILPVAGSTGYTWSVSPNTGVTINSGQGTVSANISFAQAGTFTVSVTADNTCGSSAPQTFAVVVNPTPIAPVILSNTTPVCPGRQGATYSVVNIAGTIYNWNVPPSASIVSGQGTDVLTVNWANNVVPGNYTITVTPTALGCVGPTTNFAVRVNPPPPVQPGPITGTSPVCQNQVVVFSVSPVADATSYTWSGFPSGSRITSGQGTEQVTVDFGTSAPGTYLVQLIASNSCGSSPAQFYVVTVIAPPPTPGVITPPAFHCVGTSASYVISPVSGATSYTWTNSCGWAGTSNTNSIDYVAAAGGPCTISVTANNQCGSSAPVSITITPMEVPMQPSTVSGRTIVCRGVTEQYSVQTVMGVSYTWSGIPAGASLVSGQGSGDVVINWGTVSAGVYTLTITPSNVCGNGTIRTFRVEIRDVPAQPGLISGATNLCENSNEVYSVPLVNGVMYTWSVSPAGPRLGMNNNSVEVSWVRPGSYVLTVTPMNECGSGLPRTLSVVIAPRPMVDAGLNQTVCGSNATLIGMPAGGTWSCEFCPGGANIAGAGQFGLVSGLAPDLATVFKYEVNDALCGVIVDYVLVRNDLPVPGSVNGGGTVCAGSGGTLSLTGFTPTATIIRWERSNDNFQSNIVQLNNTTPVYSYSNLTETSQFRAVVTLSGTCNEVHSFHATVVVVPDAPAMASPSLQTVCESTAILTGTVPVSGTGVWTFESGPSSANVVTNGGMGMVSGMSAEGDYVFRWTINNPPCAVRYKEVVVRRKGDVTQSIAGPNQRVCTSTATLVGNRPMNGTGVWRYVGGPSPAFVTTVGVQGLVQGMDLPGDYDFEWEITEPTCNRMSMSRLTVTRVTEPSRAFAGANRETCDNTITLVGNAPLVGMSDWTFVSGPSNVSLTVSGNVATAINLDLPGEYTFRYSIMNAPCASSFSEVKVLKISDPGQAQVFNTNVETCSNQLTLEAVRPLSGIGRWEFISGPAGAVIFTNGTNGLIDGMTVEGEYIFRWTVGNASCGTNSVNVSVYRHKDIFPSAFAGSNQQFCERSTALLSGSTPPANGRGTWRFVSGPMVPSLNQFGNFASVVNMGVAGDYVFSWTVENGICPASVSYVTVSRFANPTAAVAGPSGTICGNSATVRGNIPMVGTGSWTLVQSAGGSPNLNGQTETATLSNITVPGQYILRWTIMNGPCVPSSSDVVINVNPMSMGGNLTANNTDVCSGVNSGTLSLTGQMGTVVRWEVSDNDFNSFVIVPVTMSTMTFSNLTRSTSYRVVVKQGSCPEATSNVLRINVRPQPVMANAGNDLQICGSDVVLTGNDPMGSMGSWSVVSTPLGSPNPGMTISGNDLILNGLRAGDYVIRRTITNSCGSTNDDMVVSVSEGTNAGILAGDASICAPTNTGQLTLTGNRGNVVRWESSVNNWATITTIPQTGTTLLYSNLTRTTVYRAVVQDGFCGSMMSNEVRVSVVTPVVADAGSDVTTCGTRLTLNGNAPGAGNVGTWTKVSGGPVTMSMSGVRMDLSNLMTGTYVFRWTLTFGGVCPPSFDEVSVNVGTGTLGGEVLPSNTSVCSGTNGGVLTLGNFQGNVVRWERSTNNWNTVIPIINTTNTLNYTNLTQTTRFRAVIQAAGCGNQTSLEAVVNVSSNLPLTIDAGPDQVICGKTAMLTGSVSSPGMGVWQIVSGSPLTVLNQSGRFASLSNLQPGLTVLEYRIDRGACSPLLDQVNITVNEPANAGFMTGGQTVCNSGSGTLTLTAFTGTIVRWESSSDNFVTVQPIVNTLPTLTVTNVTRTTAYRAVVSGGECGLQTSNAALMEVFDGNYVADAGTNQIICGSSTTLTGNMPMGLIGTWTNIQFVPSSNVMLLANGNVLSVSGMTRPGDYIFRYTIVNGPCAPMNADVQVTVTDGTVAGSLTASPSAVCEGNNTGTIVLSGNVGTVVRWESSTDNFATLTTIGTTLGTLTYTNLTRSTSYRAVVENGSCGRRTTTSVNVNVDAISIGGELSSNATVCSGNNSGVIQLTGYRGTIVGWERSTDGGLTFTSVNNNSPSLSYLNLTQSTIYRVIVRNGVCAPVNSGQVVITVTTQSVGGTVTGGGTVCEGTNSAVFTLSGNVGTVVRWERSTDMNFGVNVSSINNQTLSLTLNNLNSDVYVRALVSSGTCTPSYSSTGVVTVNRSSVGGQLTGGTTVCSGINTGVLTLTGQLGTVVRWERSTDCNTYVLENNGPSVTLSYTNLTQTSCYRAVVQNGSCTSVNSNAVRIEVSSATVAGALSGDATVCPSVNTGTIVLSGNVGTVVRWEQSTDCVNYTSVNNQTNTLTYSNLGMTMCYRAVVRNGACGEMMTAASRVTVLGLTNAGTITGNVGACAGNASGVLTLSGNNGTIVRWESSTNNMGPWTVIPVVTNTLAYNNLTQTTYYRVAVQQSNCGIVTGTPVEVSVSSPTIAGTISGNATVCSGVNSGILTISGNLGTVVRWESSVNNLPFTGVQNGGNSYTYQNLTQTTRFRAVVQNGVCASALTNETIVNVSSPLNVIASSVTGCSSGGNITAQASGGNGGYVYSIIPAIQPSNNSGLFTNVPVGTYTIEVRDTRNCVSATLVTVSATANPTSITQVTNITTNSGVVNWASVPPGVGVVYNLRYRVQGEPNWTLLTNLTGTSRFLSGLQNNTTYEVEVQYVCPGGLVSDFSTGVVRTFTTLPMGTGDCATSNGSNVPVPGGIYVHNVNSSTAQVSWNPVLNSQGTIISYGPANVNPNSWLQFIVCSPTNTFLMTNLQPNTSYRVRLRTNCSNCFTALNNLDLRSIWSNQFGFITPGSKLTDDMTTSTEVSVYPNPTKGQLTVNAPSGSTAELFDLTGRLVIRTTVEATATDLSLENLSSGVYTLKVNVGTEVKVIKVVKE